MEKRAEEISRLIEHINNVAQVTILSYGMGVESTAILLRWIFEPETRPCDLNKLIVITSQVGNEWPDTGRDVEAHILPLMRQHGIRFVQVARAGHSEKDGITVLDDSRRPDTCYLEGDYSLADELRGAGTVPQYSGTHRCSLKFKAFVVDSWLDSNVREPARHSFGYNIDEQKRVDKCGAAFAEKIAFGFNKDETDRIAKGQKYDTPERTGFYPLLEWGWSRQECIDYIKSRVGVIWRKSACVFCPFSCNKQAADDLAIRQAEYPEEVAEAMMLEHISLSLNPGGVLYSNKALKDFVQERKNTAALAAYHRKLSRTPWTIYRVRRIWKGVSIADRAIEKRGDYSDQNAAEASLTAAPMGEVKHLREIAYDVVSERDKSYFPSREEYYVAAPALAQTKARYGIPKFDSRWNYEQLSLLDQCDPAS